MTYVSMKKLIERKFYADKEKPLGLLDIFLMANRITEEEYTELMLLTTDVYVEATEPEDTEIK